MRSDEQTKCDRIVRAVPPEPRRISFTPSRAIGGSQGGLFDDRQSHKGEPIVVKSVEAPATPPPKELTVAQLSELVRSTLESIASPIRVIGELSNVTERSHLYFSLKGENATISAVMWASDLARNRQRWQSGQLVVATGRLTHYAPQGRTQFSVTKLELAGVGDRELALQALLATLRTAGYFDAARKRRVPTFPRRVAVVTSRVGAAVDDVLKTAGERSALVEFVVFDVRVQGDGAAEEVAATMRLISEHAERLGVDVMLVTRGGGSREDLWAFNERVVADAAFSSRIPVVSAIGHEEDNSVLDLVADLRASTPTQAVLAIVPDRAPLREQLAQLERRLGRARTASLDRATLQLEIMRQRLGAALVGRVARERRELDRQAERVRQCSPIARASAARVQLGALTQRIRSEMDRRIANERSRLDGSAAHYEKALAQRVERARSAFVVAEHRLAAVNPRLVLARGYSVVYRTDSSGKTVIRRATDVGGGDRVEVETGDGWFGARVE